MISRPYAKVAGRALVFTGKKDEEESEEKSTEKSTTTSSSNSLRLVFNFFFIGNLIINFINFIIYN
jgi:hypothetical protein